MDKRKYILFITLLVVILISSGCINQKNNLTNQISNQTNQNNSGNNPTQTFTTLSEKQSLHNLLEKVQPSVVSIYSISANKRLTKLYEDDGSGFFISEDEIITNYHVIENAILKKKNVNFIIVRTFDEEYYLAQIKKTGNFDAGQDLAILKITDQKINPETFLETFETTKKFRTFRPLDLTLNYQVGEDIIAIGNPLGISPNSVTKGIVSNIVKENNIIYVQHTAAINPGNSGGPLLNLNGEVIGINTLKRMDAEGMNYVISSSDIINFINAEQETTEVSDTLQDTTLPNSCQNLGCPQGTSVVGSINSNLYYDCSCPAVNRIYPENLICFKTISEAKNYGYRQATKC